MSVIVWVTKGSDELENKKEESANSKITGSKRGEKGRRTRDPELTSRSVVHGSSLEFRRSFSDGAEDGDPESSE